MFNASFRDVALLGAEPESSADALLWISGSRQSGAPGMTANVIL